MAPFLLFARHLGKSGVESNTVELGPGQLMPHNIIARWILLLSMMIVLFSGTLILLRYPATLTLAVGPGNSPVLAYAREIQAALANSKEPFRVRIITTPGSRDAALLLDQGKANLAIVRSDDETSKSARSIVLLQKKTLFAIVRNTAERTGKVAGAAAASKNTAARPIAANTAGAGSAANPAAGSSPAQAVTPAKGPPIRGEADGSTGVRGRTKLAPPITAAKDDTGGNGVKSAEKGAAIPPLLRTLTRARGGVLQRRGAQDLPIVARVAGHYGMTQAGVKLKPFNRKQAEAAFRSGQLDYLIVFAHPSEAMVRALIQSARQSLATNFLLLAPPGAKGLAYQLKDLELSTLPAGVFGGNPPLPKADLESVAVTYEIVATRKMSERIAAKLTKTLTDLRTQLRGSDDGEFAIELPSTEEARRYLPHPGTVAQANGDSESFLDEYSDLFWLGLFGLGLAGSAISSLLSWLGLRRGKPSSAA